MYNKSVPTLFDLSLGFRIECALAAIDAGLAMILDHTDGLSAQPGRLSPHPAVGHCPRHPAYGHEWPQGAAAILGFLTRSFETTRFRPGRSEAGTSHLSRKRRTRIADPSTCRRIRGRSLYPKNLGAHRSKLRGPSAQFCASPRQTAFAPRSSQSRRPFLSTDNLPPGICIRQAEEIDIVSPDFPPGFPDLSDSHSVPGFVDISYIWNRSACVPARTNIITSAAPVPLRR